MGRVHPPRNCLPYSNHPLIQKMWLIVGISSVFGISGSVSKVQMSGVTYREQKSTEMRYRPGKSSFDAQGTQSIFCTMLVPLIRPIILLFKKHVIFLANLIRSKRSMFHECGIIALALCYSTQAIFRFLHFHL